MSPPPADRIETQVVSRPPQKSHPAPRLDPRPRSRTEGIVEASQAWLDAQL